MIIRDATRRCRELLAGKRLLASIAVVLLMASFGVLQMSTSSEAGTDHTVTFVNDSGETLWIGSMVNADGSHAIGNLPALADGQSATISIPDNGAPNYWRGTFFARQGCTGESGSSFHCSVGDCGAYADHCAHGGQPTSLAEFNFDRNDGLAPWYDVSYVDAVSLPITISSPSAGGSPPAGSCINVDCSGGEMLAACPPDYAQNDERGKRIVCVNPNRDAETSYTRAMGAFNPRAYLWSTHDRVPANSTMFNCAGCSDFVITFHGSGSSGTPPPPAAEGGGPAGGGGPPEAGSQGGAAQLPEVHRFHGYAGKCIDVPGGLSNDGVQLQLRDCNGLPAQAFTSGPHGSQVVLGKCMDVAWAATDNGTHVQLAWRNGGPAQVWTYDGTSLRNPNSGKCVDVTDGNPDNGALLQIWDCIGSENQTWNAEAAGG